ncbi:uncharacterized protein LOC143196241 [Rhynchophorus ferrugineus]|uniref:CCC domain-containing protein n=1 Tax=Rhynchophorus ferrugineus TaxID=354439 RepID=A0A834HMV7_RHYFE|nr:hypothetical protein GWI33_021365 [Rhynchophorus ferrugineus]
MKYLWGVVMISCVHLCQSTTILPSTLDSPFTSLSSGITPTLGLSSTLGLRQGLTPTFNSLGPFSSMLKRRCPICDSSVYGYCSDKLFHDSCCCNDPSNPYDQLPFQCQYADCTFLHANSCREHKLITACCCTNFLFYRK